MARASTTSDVFNAIAEPRRRQIIALLARSPSCTVGDLVLAIGLDQPIVSKHLAVLRTVGLVSVARQGKNRHYTLNAQALKAVHDWTSQFEVHWSRQLSRIKRRAEKSSENQTKDKSH